MPPALSAVRLEFAPSDGHSAVATLGLADADAIAAGHPVRTFPMHAHMKHYPGWWWSATTNDLVAYESLLERDRLMLADFDTTVEAIAAQPFGLSGPLHGVERHHVPDFLLRTSSGTLVVDVKPARVLKRVEVAEVLEWTASLMAQRGWRYEVWSGDSRRRLENVRFIAQGRRPFVEESALAALRSHEAVGASLASVLKKAEGDWPASPGALRAAMLRLLWLQEWHVDLTEPLDGASRILQAGAGAAA